MRKITLLILVVLIFFATFRIWMPAIGQFLIVNDNLKKADCIVVLRGDDFYPFKKAVELYQNGYAGRIVLSPLAAYSETMQDYYDFRNKFFLGGRIYGHEMVLEAFEYLGKNEQDIYFTSKETDSTYDEAIATKEWMQLHGHQSLILIANTYHMRRSLFTFKKIFKGSDIEIYNSTADNLMYTPSQWWRNERDVRRVFEEYLAFAFNVVYRFVLNKNDTSFDTMRDEPIVV